MKRFIAVVLLPLSLVPVALAVPYVADEHASYQARYLDRGSLPAPAVGPADAPRAPAYRDRIPTLVYHGINDSGARYTATQEAFAGQMAALDAAGYHAVGADTYARFVRGEPVRLPSRPILITFDDGRIDSFRGADAVLERHGLQATMFAIAGETIDGSLTYLSPDELDAMEASEQWDVRFHGGQGHQRLDSGRPFYAGLLDGEPVAEFRHRVEEDLDAGRERLGELVPGAALDDLFAVPYSDYGQYEHVGIAATIADVLLDRFDVMFVQHSDVTPVRRGGAGIVTRFEPPTGMTPDALLRTLREGLAR